MAITAVSNLSDRVQDYTLDALTQALGVPLTRTISTTLPLTGGGALSSNLTIAINQFSDVASGVVPASGGGTTNFLRADGSWTAGTVSGVPSNRTLTTTAPLTIDGGASADLSADRTLDVSTFTSLTSGIVPASGGGTTAYLRADGSWANPFGGGGSGPWVHLDANHPGTTDTGNAHVSGWLEADTAITNSSAASTRNSANLGSLQIEAKVANDGVAIEGYGTVAVPPSLIFRRGRGSLASPTVVTSGDVIGEVISDAVPTNTSSHTYGHAIQLVADTPQANEVPWNLRLKSGYSAESGSYFHWMLQNGQVFGKNIASKPTPNADNEFLGSFAIKPRSITSAAYQVAEDDCILTCDATANDVVITIPWNSSARRGRLLIIKRVDNTQGRSVTVNSPVGPLDQRSTHSMWSNESVTLYGDGVSGWRVIQIERPRYTQTIPGSALSNTTTNTAISNGIYLPLLPMGSITGSIYRIRAGGKYSTTGTPTLRLTVAVGDLAQILLDSTALTTASGVTNADWGIDLDLMCADGALGTINHPYSGAYTSLGDASGVMTRHVSRVATVGDATNSTVYVWAKWGSASASNTITCEYASMQFIPGGMFT